MVTADDARLSKMSPLSSSGMAVESGTRGGRRGSLMVGRGKILKNLLSHNPTELLYNVHVQVTRRINAYALRGKHEVHMQMHDHITYQDNCSLLLLLSFTYYKRPHFTCQLCI